MDIIVASPAALALVPLVMGLVQLAKMYMNSRYAPLLSLALGIGGAFLVTDAGHTSTAIISGIIIGLNASGLYAGVKTTMAGE